MAWWAWALGGVVAAGALALPAPRSAKRRRRVTVHRAAAEVRFVRGLPPPYDRATLVRIARWYLKDTPSWDNPGKFAGQRLAVLTARTAALEQGSSVSPAAVRSFLAQGLWPSLAWNDRAIAMAAGGAQKRAAIAAYVVGFYVSPAAGLVAGTRRAALRALFLLANAQPPGTFPVVSAAAAVALSRLKFAQRLAVLEQAASGADLARYETGSLRIAALAVERVSTQFEQWTAEASGPWAVFTQVLIAAAALGFAAVSAAFAAPIAAAAAAATLAALEAAAGTALATAAVATASTLAQAALAAAVAEAVDMALRSAGLGSLVE